MKEILKNEKAKPLQVGKVIEGIVLGQEKGCLFVKLGEFKTGRIYGIEFYKYKDKLEKLKPGEKIIVKILDIDDENGYVDLAVGNLEKELILANLKEKKERKEIFEVKITGANRGGLLTTVFGLPAFLPVSQLSPQNYPKVEDGNKAKILEKLQSFVGKTIKVQVLTLLSEKQVILKEAREDSESESLEREEIEGEVTGITSFGVLVKIDKEKEGLIAKNLISDLKDLKIGQRIKVKIKEIREGKIELLPLIS